MSGMAEIRLVLCVLFCAGVLLCSAAPPRWQGTEATVTDAWADEFDLDGDKGWMGDIIIPSSSIPPQSDYEDYDDDDDEEKPSVDEGGQDPSQAEFLFVPSRDNRLLLQDDDDDQSGPIKVRHTGKNLYPEVTDNSDEDTNDSSHQFEFTIDNGDDDDDDKDNEVDNTNDFVLDDAPRKDDIVLPQQEVRDDDDDDDDDSDDDNFVSDGDNNNDQMFETPEEDSQVIYGDHVFLY